MCHSSLLFAKVCTFFTSGLCWEAQFLKQVNCLVWNAGQWQNISCVANQFFMMYAIYHRNLWMGMNPKPETWNAENVLPGARDDLLVMPSITEAVVSDLPKDYYRAVETPSLEVAQVQNAFSNRYVNSGRRCCCTCFHLRFEIRAVTANCNFRIRSLTRPVMWVRGSWSLGFVLLHFHPSSWKDVIWHIWARWLKKK